MSARRPWPTRMKVEGLEVVEDRGGKLLTADAGSDTTVFCCVAAAGDKKISYSYSHRKQDAGEAMALAALCLDHAPLHHRWHCHTVGARTFGYLMADGRIYFAVVEPSPGSKETVRFLEHVRSVYNTVPKKRLDDAVAPVVRRLVAALEDGHGRRAPPVKGIGEGVEGPRYVKLSDHGTSPDGGRREVSGRSLWRRIAVTVVAGNVVLCLVLFGVWVAVCHGFKCVSRQ